MPNLAVDVNSWARSACYPRSTFYPLSDGPSIQNHRITMTCFRTCSTCRSRSQAGFCPYTRRTISNRAEPTFERLRYPLGGDRPSQTAHLPLSAGRLHGLGVRALAQSGWYLNVASPEAGAPGSPAPTYPAQTPPKLHDRLQSRFTGSFRLLAGSQHLHWRYSFTGSLAETAAKSLRHSCRSELTRQGISLP